MIHELIFEVAFEAIFKAAFYWLGRALVFVLSRGRWACDSFLAEAPKKERRYCGLLCCGKEGLRLTADGTATVGTVFVAALVAWGMFAACARTGEPPAKRDGRSPDGNAVIRGRTGSGEIAIKTTQRLAGAIDSLTFNGKEFIDSADHGRQLQSAASFDCARPGEFWAECYNPTEAGSRDDGAGAVSTSKLLGLRAQGDRLATTTQMAFWLSPGERSSNRPALNDTRLSRHLVSKRVRIGYKELPQVIDYRVAFTVPAGERHTYAQFEALTGYMPAEFNQFCKYDVAAGNLVPLDDGPGEQASPVVLATADGSHAMGVFSPDQPSPGYEQAGYGRFRFAQEKVVKWNCVFRVRDADAIRSGDYPFRVFVAVGTLAEVTHSLARLCSMFLPRPSSR